MSIVWKELGSGGAKIASGQITDDGGISAFRQIECGFKPKYICVHTSDCLTLETCCIYNEEVSKTKVFYAWENGSDYKISDYIFMTDDEWRQGNIREVNDTGFKIGRIMISSNVPLQYFAVG